MDVYAYFLNRRENNRMSKPKVFVASSVEGLSAAYCIQTNLQYDCDCTVWPQGVFQLSTSPLDSLTEQLGRSDFSIFVFTPDDDLSMRGDTEKTVRDNVLFELGLFCGRLGKQRCFVVTPDATSMHIPSDLTGLTPATYSSQRDADEMHASLGPACHQIRQTMKKLGRLRPDTPAQKIPVNDADSYDDGDKELLIADWLDMATPDVAYKFTDVDEELKLDRGTSKRLLRGISEKRRHPRITEESTQFFKLG